MDSTTNCVAMTYTIKSIQISRENQTIEPSFWKLIVSLYVKLDVNNHNEVNVPLKRIILR